MKANKITKALASTLIIFGALLVSEGLLYVMALFSNIVIGDMGGYIYTRMLVPCAITILTVVLIFHVPGEVYEKNKILNILLIIIILSFMVHLAALNFMQIGWHKE